MGRLTLNILLSFAQFEREVTSERIRDKFRASKEKGMWMGGYMPLGYDVENRKLVVNEKEAVLVKYSFDEYLKLGSVYKLKARLNKEGHTNKCWVTPNGKTMGGSPLSKTTLYSILTNPLYIGKMAHKNKGKVYDGQHPAIVKEDIFNKVQKKISSYRSTNSGKMQPTNYMLQGKCFDINDKPFTTTYTNKNNSKKLGYYFNAYTKQWVNQRALDKVIIQGLQVSLTDEEIWYEFLSRASAPLHQEQTLHKLQQLVWSFDMLPYKMQVSTGQQFIEKVTILNDSIVVRVKNNSQEALASHEFSGKAIVPEIGNLKPTQQITEEYLEITLPISFRQCGKRKLAFDQSGKVANIIQEDRADMTLIKALTKSYRWNKMLENGEAESISEIAKAENIDRCRVGKILDLIFLPPKLVTSILNGTQHPDLRMQHLLDTNLRIP